MAIKVRYFARVRDLMGASEEVVEAAGLNDAAALVEHLASRGPEGAEALRHPSIRVEVNGVIGPRTVPIADGDEVALLPPFSGG
jgi:molybdopterin converting factor small subunit